MDTTPHIDGLTIDGPLGWGGPTRMWKAHTSAGDDRVVRAIPKGTIPHHTHARRLAALTEAGGDHIARVVSLHERDTCFYLVSEFIPGPALATVRTGGGGLTIPEAWRVLADLCGALVELHRVGIVHGDVSPANILLRTAGGRARPVLIDLGGGDAWELGTVGFRAPELSQGHPPSVAADVWSAAKVATWAVADAERWQFAAKITAALAEDPAERPRARELQVEAETQASPAISLPEPARLAGAQLRAQSEHEPTRMARRTRARIRPTRGPRRQPATGAGRARPMRGPRHARAGARWVRGAAVVAAVVVGTSLTGHLVTSVFSAEALPAPQSHFGHAPIDPGPGWSIPGLAVDPAEVAVDLTVSRDAALTARSAEVLAEVTVPGSPAAAADAALLAAFGGSAPTRLRTQAQVVAVSGTKDAPVVTMELVQSAFTWEGGTRSGVRVEATPARCADMHLARHEGTWRVADVRPCQMRGPAVD